MFNQQGGRTPQSRTTPNNAAFDVYRSLPVSVQARNAASGSPSAESAVLQQKQQVNASSAASPQAIPYPPVPLSCMQSERTIWLQDIDLEATRAKLLAVCSKVELCKTSTTCEFHCTAQAQDGGEQVDFIINYWRVPEGEEGAQGKYFAQSDRCSGCPYFYRQTISKAFDVPDFRKCHGKLFRVPKLPECMCDQGKGIKKECVENAINLATSDCYEQRLQGLKVLADLCAEKNPIFVSIFQSVDGPLRIAKLNGDDDTCVKRAVSRILSVCSC